MFSRQLNVFLSGGLINELGSLLDDMKFTRPPATTTSLAAQKPAVRWGMTPCLRHAH
jgi:hypothetical protein